MGLSDTQVLAPGVDAGTLVSSVTLRALTTLIKLVPCTIEPV